jgi:hypothetical protein
MPLIVGYLWSETSRPSGSIKDVSKLVESMTNYDSGGNSNYVYDPYNTNHNNNYQPTPTNNNNQIVVIISDDNSEKIEIKDDELDTLINSGYVNKTKGKYTFRKDKKEEIVSLLDGTELAEDGIYEEEEASI